MKGLQTNNKKNFNRNKSVFLKKKKPSFPKKIFWPPYASYRTCTLNEDTVYFETFRAQKRYKKFRRHWMFHMFFRKSRYPLNKVQAVFKKRLVLHKHFRSTLYPGFKLKAWKAYLKNFKQTSGHQLANFMWYLDSRIDLFLLRLRLGTTLPMVHRLLNLRKVFVNFNVVTSPQMRLEIPSLIQFSLYETEQQMFSKQNKTVPLARVTSRNTPAHANLLNLTQYCTAMGENHFFFVKQWRFNQYVFNKSGNLFNLNKHLNYIEYNKKINAFYILKNPYLKIKVLKNLVYTDLYKQLYENKFFF